MKKDVRREHPLKLPASLKETAARLARKMASPQTTGFATTRTTTRRRL